MNNFSRDQKATFSLLWYFFFQGSFFGNYAALIPVLKDDHNVSNGVLGGILVVAIVGAIISLPLVVKFNQMFGSNHSVFISSLMLCGLFLICGIPGPYWILILGFVSFGFGMGWIDVCLNCQAVLLEKSTKSHKLGLCHCFYGIGGLIGALVGGALIQVGLSSFYEIAVFSGFLIIPSFFFQFFLYSLEEEKFIENQSNNVETSPITEKLLLFPSDGEGTPPALADNDSDNNSETKDTNIDPAPHPNRLLIGLCLLGGLAYLGEGSIGDWSAVFLNEELSASPFISTLGFVFFQLCAILGRLSSDTFQKYFSRSFLLQVCGLLACVGLSIVSLSPSITPSLSSLVVAIIGFAICGSGLGMVAPIVISGAGASSSLLKMQPAEAIAYVSSFSYLGVMIGPPLIGGLSVALNGLRFALLVDGLLLFCVTPIGAFLIPRSIPNLNKS